jgi:hypothetical protein
MFFRVVWQYIDVISRSNDVAEDAEWKKYAMSSDL